MTDQEQRLADGAACLAAALEYLARGWSAIPLCPWDHVGVGRKHAADCKPGSHGKGPLVGWKPYQTRRPTADDVRGWWRQWPNANVGVVMGPVSGLVGVDVEGEAGWNRLLQISGGEIPTTLSFDTPGGGMRLLFQTNLGLEFVIAYESFEAEKKHSEVRILALGSQTVMPPSRHRSGGYYAWRKPV